MHAIRATLLIATAVLSARGVLADEVVQSLEAVQDAALSFLRKQADAYSEPPKIAVGTLDSRLRLSPCELPLEPFLPRGGQAIGNVVVGVRCPGERPWTVYLQAQVRPLARVVVTRRAISRGVLLTAEDVQLQERDLSRLTGGYLTDLSAAIGMRLRRSVAAELALNDSMLQPPVVIRRGERVTILAKGEGIEVRMEGEALEDGARGELIRVRNRSSRRVVEAAVVAPGIVQVRM